MKIVVYTAITGLYDFLKPVPRHWETEARFEAFLDESQASNGWVSKSLPNHCSDPCRRAKLPKVMPHLFFPDVDYSIWIDGSVEIISPFGVMGLLQSALARNDIALFRHRRRKCIYEEAEVCIEKAKDDPKLIKNQVQLYRQEGYPLNNGLAECTIILRRHTPAIQAFNLAWYHEICTHSRRDQLSFNYVAWRLGLQYGLLDGTIASNAHFRRGQHNSSDN
jgi:hypothetical protein